MKKLKIKLDSYSALSLGLIAASLIWFTPLIVTLLRPHLINTGLRHTTFANAESATSATQGNYFTYDALGINSPLQISTTLNPIDVKDWDKIRSVLQKGVSLIAPGSALSQVPLLFVIGHSSDVNLFNPYAYVFAGLGQAKKGDSFTMSVDGKKLTYNVIDNKVLRPGDIKGFANLQPTDPTVQRVAVVTCTPLYTSLNRRVVLGERKL